MKEQFIQKKILNYLEDNGHYCLKLAKTNKNGIPDIIAIKQNEVFFIEVKSEKGIVSELQKHRIDELKQNGIKTLVVRSLDELKSLLK
tara:strand:- start:23062 stop:23325 length:264 start_codon:yes stop_codon:yes gene_type:complete